MFLLMQCCFGEGLEVKLDPASDKILRTQGKVGCLDVAVAFEIPQIGEKGGHVACRDSKPTAERGVHLIYGDFGNETSFTFILDVFGSTHGEVGKATIEFSTVKGRGVAHHCIDSAPGMISSVSIVADGASEI